MKPQRKEKSRQVRLRTGVVLKSCVSESKQKRRKIERVRENTRKRAVSEKKKTVFFFFFLKLYLLSIVISI